MNIKKQAKLKITSISWVASEVQIIRNISLKSGIKTYLLTTKLSKLSPSKLLETYILVCSYLPFQYNSLLLHFWLHTSLKMKVVHKILLCKFMKQFCFYTSYLTICFNKKLIPLYSYLLETTKKCCKKSCVYARVCLHVYMSKFFFNHNKWLKWDWYPVPENTEELLLEKRSHCVRRVPLMSAKNDAVGRIPFILTKIKLHHAECLSCGQWVCHVSYALVQNRNVKEFWMFCDWEFSLSKICDRLLGDANLLPVLH